jgi:hypothetical protein
VKELFGSFGGAGFCRFLFDEGAEDGEVFEVFVEIFAFGCFEAAGVIFEAGVVEDVAERFFADFALADAGVAVDAGVEVGFGIVEVEGEDLLKANLFFDLANGVVPAAFGAEVETGLEEVSGVQTDAEALGTFYAVEDLGEVFDFVTEAAPLPRGVFEGDADGAFFGDGEDFVEAFDDAFDALFFAFAEVGAGVHDEEWEAEGGGELDFLDKGFDGVVPVGARFGAEVDEVTGVAEDGVEFAGGKLVGVVGEFLWFVGAAEPLHVVLYEELDDVAAESDAAFKGSPGSAGGGHVGAEFHGAQYRWRVVGV